MYRAALLCALLLLVAAPSHISAAESVQKIFEAPKHALAPEPDRAPLLPPKQTNAAPAAGSAVPDAASNVVPTKPIDTSAGNAAASVPAPAKDVAGAAQQQQGPTPAAQQQQQQSKPAAAAAPTPTVAQPAAPQLAGNLAAPAQKPAQAQVPQQPAPIAAQQPAPVATQQPNPAAAAQPGAKPAPQQPQPSAPVQNQAELQGTNSQAHAIGHHHGEPGASHQHKTGVQHANSYPNTGSLKSTDNIDGGEGWSTYEAPEYRHHAGKAAKKLYRAYQRDQEMDIEDDLNSKLAAYDRLQRLQKYYDTEADILAAEDEGVSSFARPTSGAAQHYSSKAAKYAAQALKAQQKAKAGETPTQGSTSSSKAPTQQPQAQTQAPQGTGLAGFAAALLRKAAADKPAPDAAKALKAESVAAPEQLDEQSFEEYLATPEGAKLLAHEQHRSSKRQQAAAKKQATQMLRQTSSRVNADGHKHPTAGRIADVDDDLFADADDEYYGQSNSYNGYDPDYEEYLAKKYGKKYADVDPMDPANVKHSKLAMKGMRDSYLFRSMPGSVIQNVGYTVAPTTIVTTQATAKEDTKRPVMLTYEADLTCGDTNITPLAIGQCLGFGMLPQGGSDMQQAQMTFTCTIHGDASTQCGLRYIQGMSITAQGPVTVKLTNGDAPYSIQGQVVPITGAYVPGRRATLLGDVLTLLSGVKGGSLAIEVKPTGTGAAATTTGMFNFFFWR